MQQYLKVALSAVVALSFLGCDSSDSSSNSGASSVSLQDFTPKYSVSPLTKSDFLEEINSESGFFNTSPESTTSSCTADMLETYKNNQNYTFKKSDDDSFFIEINDIDMMSCGSFTEASINLYYNKVVVNSSNTQIDISGETLAILDNENYRSSGRILSVVHIKDVRTEGIIEVTSYSSITDTKDFEKACNEEVSSCTQRFVSNVEFTGVENVENYSTQKTLTQKATSVINYKTDSYYTSGSVEFVINNWSGEMQYSGAEVAPTFTAQSSDDSVSGTFLYVEN